MMATTLLASAVSEPGQQQGQNNRSGPDFYFVNLPSGSTAMSITIRNAFMHDNDGNEIPADDYTSFNLMQDKSSWFDPTVNGSPLMNGSTLTAKSVSGSNRYYIANPKVSNPSVSGKQALLYNFIVIFTAQS
jgi:hypothetical protein